MRFNVYRMSLIIAIMHGQGMKQAKGKPFYLSATWQDKKK